MSTEDRIRKYIVEELHYNGPELTDDYPLLDENVIDSLGIFHIVSFLEREFGVEVEDQELVPEHFGTIKDIAELVQTKQG